MVTLAQKRERQKQLQQMEELADVTFTPAIKGSKQRGLRQKGIKTEDFLLFQGRLTNEKRQRLKKDLERQEMEEASFQPKILKKSAQIIQRRNERLYAENVSDAKSTVHDPS